MLSLSHPQALAPDSNHSITHRRSRRALSGAVASVALLALFASQPAAAHHAFAAEYDGNQPITVTGTVTKAQWVNPHSWLYVDVKDAKGTVTNWGWEFGAPFSLREKGLTKTTLPIGAEVKLQGFKSKSGQTYAYASTLTLSDGRVFQTGGAGDAPATPAAGAK
jgi:hypothetical protein